MNLTYLLNKRIYLQELKGIQLQRSGNGMGMKQDIIGAFGMYIHLIYIVNAYLGVTLSSVMIGRLLLDKQKLGRCLNINVLTIFDIFV